MFMEIRKRRWRHIKEEEKGKEKKPMNFMQIFGEWKKERKCTLYKILKVTSFLKYIFLKNKR